MPDPVVILALLLIHIMSIRHIMYTVYLFDLIESGVMVWMGLRGSVEKLAFVPDSEALGFCLSIWLCSP